MADNELIQVPRPILGRPNDPRLDQDYINSRPELAGVEPFDPEIDVDLVGEINDKLGRVHALVAYADPELAERMLQATAGAEAATTLAATTLGRTTIPTLADLPDTAGVYNVLGGAEAGQTWERLADGSQVRRPELEAASKTALEATTTTAEQALAEAQSRLGVLELSQRQGVSLLDYGAVSGTGMSAEQKTANARAFKAACDDAKARGLVVRALGTFEISETAVITWHFDGTGCIILAPATLNPALDVGVPGEYTYNLQSVLPEVLTTKAGTGWADGGTGIRLLNAYHCDIVIPRVRNFARGLYITAFGRGNSYNNLYLGHLENNMVNLEITQGDATSWVNENVLLGGRFSHYSAEGVNVPGARHILMGASKGGNGPANNNKFVKPSLEGKTPEWHWECSGTYNHIDSARWETGDDVPRVLFDGEFALDNVIAYGYSAWKIVATERNGAARNHILTTRWSAWPSPQYYKNPGGNTQPIHRGYEATKDVTRAALADTDWAWEVTAQQWRGKRSAEAQPRVIVDFNLSRLYVGNGVVAPAGYLSNYGSLGLSWAGGRLYGSGAYNGNFFQLGNLRMWTDASNRLRMHTADPSSDTAGVVVQTTVSGASTARPASPATGQQFFDTTLGKPIWWSGSAWVDATGTTL